MICIPFLFLEETTEKYLAYNCYLHKKHIEKIKATFQFCTKLDIHKIFPSFF
jgi:hypothetical protein